MIKCSWHLCDKEAKIKFCSTKCKTKANVHAFRKNIKRKAVEYKGGKCVICGYNKCLEALQFHHLDPKEKDFGLSAGGHTRKWETVKKELDKCICVCGNCHVEIHLGIANIPL